MSVMEQLEAEVEAAFGGDEGDIHVYCCRPNLALCGVDLLGDDAGPAEGGGIDCIRCEVLHEAGVPCGAPLCRLRSWWRDRWAS